MDPVSVLIVDDSALMRSLIGRMVESTNGLVIADKAMNGQFALQKIPNCMPDVIVLDIEMPVMTGVQFLEERKKRGIDIPVVILSSVAREGAKITMECLRLGASDFVTKPSGSDSSDIASVASVLTNLLLGFGRQYQNKKRRGDAFPTGKADSPFLTAQIASSISDVHTSLTSTYARNIELPCEPQLPVVKKQKTGPIVPLRQSGNIQIIVIGISTGGPNALREIFSNLDAQIKQPFLVVQHMPAGFTEEFANSLNTVCPLEVKEAKDGDLVKSGRILIAPGDKHIIVEKKSLANVVRLSDEEPRNGHRPSVDVLFESVSKIYQNHALAVIMTGMGRDGAVMLAELRRQGSRTIGQDEESSVVYGMPKVAFEMGGVERQIPLSKIAEVINESANEYK